MRKYWTVYLVTFVWASKAFIDCLKSNIVIEKKWTDGRAV
ncbi:hypothetical protein wTpre_855 [Wolbachia endosymbiont of Trichogramma pretiosum]|nr:hypothetical protein wTpre_855 [Wolbachia endosymbiont of Trichogramma pretiosum]